MIALSRRMVRLLHTFVVLFLLGSPVAQAIEFVEGHYYSTNYFESTVIEYDALGNVVGTTTLPGLLPDESTHGLAFGPDGLLYVVVQTDEGFRVDAIGDDGTVHASYEQVGWFFGNLSYGKIEFDGGDHFYVAGAGGVYRFTIGSAAPPARIWNNGAFGLSMLPSGNLLVAESYDVREITPQGVLVRSLNASDPNQVAPGALVRFTDVRDVMHQIGTDRIFATHLGHSGFSFKIMRLSSQGVLEAHTTFHYADNLLSLGNGSILVGSRTMAPAIFDENLNLVRQFAGPSRMFVAAYPPVFAVPPGPQLPQLEIVQFGASAGGDPVSGEPAGVTYRKFGVPSINNAGQAAFTAQLQSDSGTQSAVVAGSPATVLVRKGDAAPGLTAGSFVSFRDPLLSQNGTVTFRAIVEGDDITPENREGIWSNTFGGGLQLVAREGVEAPGVAGSVLKSFTSVAAADGAVAFTGKMLTGPKSTAGPGGVTSGNDLGLWMRQGASTTLALREGQSLAGRTVKSFKALANRSGAGGQGHGVVKTTELAVAVWISFTSGEQAWCDAHGAGVLTVIAISGDAAPEEPVANFKGFTPPVQTPAGAGATVATLSLVGSGADTAIVYEDAAFELARLVGEGDAAPGISGTTFSQFGYPVMNSQRSLAFSAKIRGGSEIDSTIDQGLWWKSIGALTLVAREGSTPPGCEGAVWRSFSSLALPENGGPLFTAKLVPAINVVTTKNDFALWGMDSKNTVHLLLREGQALEVAGTPRTLRSFTTLTSVSGSHAQTRSHNNRREVIARLYFNDGSQAVAKITLP